MHCGDGYVNGIWCGTRRNCARLQDGVGESLDGRYIGQDGQAINCCNSFFSLLWIT